MTLPEAFSDERDLSKMGNRYLDASPFDMPNRSTAWMRDRSQAPLPLVIGITGHRDPRPEDREILEARVRAVFMEIQKRCPATPLVLLSPLAEGADRLAARVVLACGAHLIVPLPMPQVVYEQDFQTPASLAEFRELLQRADRHFELPWADLVARETSGLNGEGRDRAYALLAPTSHITVRSSSRCGMGRTQARRGARLKSSGSSAKASPRTMPGLSVVIVPCPGAG